MTKFKSQLISNIQIQKSKPFGFGALFLGIYLIFVICDL